MRRMARAEDSKSSALGEGDSDILRTLSDRYRAPLMAFFSRRTGGYEEAEDLAQDVLLRVLQRKDLNDVEQPDAFIFKTARNLLQDRAKRARVVEKNQVELEIREEATEGLSPERVIQGKQELSRALSALDQLKDKTRAIFILSRLEGMKYREIAELYGISVSAVEKHLIHAFAHMLDSMDDE